MQQAEKLVLIGGLSRSGTTLLSAALDAHPRISAGAELIPAAVPDLARLRAALVETLTEDPDFSVAGRALRARLDAAQGSFVARCYRAGATPEDLLDTLDAAIAQGRTEATAFPDRFALAAAVIGRRRAREATECGSFKINTPSLVPVLESYPGATVVFMLRHPAAVVASHLRNDFGKTPEAICDAWLNYLVSFARAKARFPDRVAALRYEDLVADPRAALTEIFRILPVAMDESVLRYHEGDTRILSSRHPNTEQLRGGFQPAGTSAPGDLDPAVASLVAERCGTAMAEWDYEP